MSIKNILHKYRTKTIPKDDFMKRLPSSVIGQGMLHEGNLHLINHAIKNMPDEGYVMEIGVYGGFSTNLILHLLKKHHRPHQIVGCDAWIYEGFHDHREVTNLHIDGRKDVERTAFMDYIKNAYINSLRLLSPERLPYTCHLKSDEFFHKWNTQTRLTDVFERSFHLNQKISFCYIDGDHSYEQTKADFENVSKFILPNGFILIDDSADYMSFGSARFINDLKKRNDYRIVDCNPNYLVQKIN